MEPQRQPRPRRSQPSGPESKSATGAAPAEAGAATPTGRIRAVQRLAGNAAATQLIRSGGLRVQRTPVSEARTPADVQQISSFAGISDSDRLRLINIVLDQVWVGMYDEGALERLWGSLDEDGLVRFADANPGLWEHCLRRGADLREILPYRRIQARFRDDVTELARRHLATNRGLVQSELTALDSGGAPPSPEQTARIAGLQEAANVLVDLQRAQEAAREARVGWRVGDGGDVDPDWTGRDVKYQVPFRPGRPPPLTEEPADLHFGDVLVYPIVPYDAIEQHYGLATQAIAELTDAYPALFGFVRGGSSATTEAFVEQADTRQAGEQVSAPLRRVLADIDTTRGHLGGELDPLDLEPLHRQLFGEPVWAAGFRHRVATTTVIGHNISRALARLAMQNVQQLAFLFAPFTSGWSLLALLAVGTTAAGVEAYSNYREVQVMTAAEGSAVRPGTELVNPGSAEAAQLHAEASYAAFGLALLALGTGAFAAWRAGAQARALRTQRRIRMHHGTDQSGLEGTRALGEGRIDVTRAAGEHQDLSQGFYLTLDEETAGVYGRVRGQQRGGGMQHTLTFELDAAELGNVVDIRPGGNFRAQWDQFLREPPFPGMPPVPGFETNRGLLRMAPEQRGVVFERFLTRIGRQGADTIFAPLGDEVFTGITSGRQTTQVCIRSQRVADRLNQQIRTGR